MIHDGAGCRQGRPAAEAVQLTVHHDGGVSGGALQRNRYGSCVLSDGRLVEDRLRGPVGAAEVSRVPLVVIAHVQDDGVARLRRGGRGRGRDGQRKGVQEGGTVIRGI